MEDVIDLIATDYAASDSTDRIKEVLYGKAAEKIEGLRPGVANSMFGEDEQVDDTESNEDQE